MEDVLPQQAYRTLEKFYVLNKNKYGYRTGKSTQAAIIELVYDALKGKEHLLRFILRHYTDQGSIFHTSV